jgi:hypothetical protein|tara:strand:- start:1234 stop:1437 length:204 start_codon:yes stop_codon:yes gene_type:complete
MLKIIIMTKQDTSSRIIWIETTIMKALKEGHQPNTGDKYQSLRIEAEILRCIYYGNDSSNCRRIYTK